MSGIAGYRGTASEALDAASLCGALSFTGMERREEVRREDFLGMAVAHETDASRCPPLYDDGMTLILLDGYITAIEGTPFDPARPGDALALCAGLFRSEGTAFARRLNGSFALAVCDLEENAIHLICDRMATRHLYYMERDGVLAFASRIEALGAMGLDPTRRLNRQAFVEFMVYGRLLISDIWEDVKSVPPATALSLQSGELRRRSYWDLKFTYDREAASLEDNAERLVAALRGAVRRSTAGFDSVGHLLSGGIDSRTILTCLPADAVCYTACDRPNPETRIAARAARLHGCRHVPLVRSPRHYYDILPGAARSCEGAFAYMHAHLENLYPRMDEVAGGVLLCGFMFNILLRAETIPLPEKHIAGGSYTLPLPPRYRDEAEVERAFLGLIAVRLKGLDVLVDDLRGEADSHLLHTIRSFLDECSPQVAGMYDFFDLYGLKRTANWRHSPILHSIRDNHAERCPALDNAILDITLTTPPEQRFGAKLLRKALHMLDPRMLALLDANTLLPAAAGPWLRAAMPPRRLYNSLSVHVLRRTIHRHAPAWTLLSGSWHNMALFWRYGPLPGRLEHLLSDGAAMQDGVVDAGAARALLSQHLRGAANHTETLARLITFLQYRSTFHF